MSPLNSTSQTTPVSALDMDCHQMLDNHAYQQAHLSLIDLRSSDHSSAYCVAMQDLAHHCPRYAYISHCTPYLIQQTHCYWMSSHRQHDVDSADNSSDSGTQRCVGLQTRSQLFDAHCQPLHICR